MAGSEGFRKFAAQHNERGPRGGLAACLPLSVSDCYTFHSVINTPCKRLGDTRLRSSVALPLSSNGDNGGNNEPTPPCKLHLLSRRTRNGRQKEKETLPRSVYDRNNTFIFSKFVLETGDGADPPN